jgi:hypothetical protein
LSNITPKLAFCFLIPLPVPHARYGKDSRRKNLRRWQIRLLPRCEIAVSAE